MKSRRCPDCRHVVTETCAYGSCHACHNALLCQHEERHEKKGWARR